MEDTTKRCFRKPKKVLIFDEHRILACVVKSLHCATQITRITTQTISLCCTGQRISSNGFYFRHSHPDVIINLEEDVDHLSIEEFDDLCGVKREYHSVTEMKRRRYKAGRINKRSK